MFDNRLSLQRGDFHFSLPTGGKRFIYAYIRKNGCSAFKRAVGLPSDAHVAAMIERYEWRPFRRRHDGAIFVWRDPLDRLLSLYKNKILDAQHNGDIWRTYCKTMAEEPSTFERFVEFATTGADPHCIPQYKHLKPLRYTHAIELSELGAAMADLVGEEAARPFQHPVNASKSHEVHVSSRARELIERHYAKDYRMIELIRRHRARGSTS